MARSTDKKEEAAEERPAPARRGYFDTAPSHHGWVYGVAAVLILILVFAAGMGVAHRRGSVGFKSISMVRGPGGGFGGGFGNRSGGFRGGFGNSTTANGQTRLSGVVTAVNGSSFTLAGNGSTTNVATNSSTQYQDGNQVKVDDTVVVVGTESSGTLTAAQVVINP